MSAETTPHPLLLNVKFSRAVVVVAVVVGFILFLCVLSTDYKDTDDAPTHTAKANTGTKSIQAFFYFFLSSQINYIKASSLFYALCNNCNQQSYNDVLLMKLQKQGIFSYSYKQKKSVSVYLGLDAELTIKDTGILLKFIKLAKIENLYFFLLHSSSSTTTTTTGLHLFSVHLFFSLCKNLVFPKRTRSTN